MNKFKKYINRYDENGFINTEHEQLEKYMMIGSLILISITLVSLVIWTIIESGTHH